MKALVSLIVALQLLGSVLFLHPAGAQPRDAQQQPVYVPLALGSSSESAPPAASPGPQPAPAPSPPAGTVPAELAGTWFSGGLLPRDLYDPATGRWGSANGLGQLYEFGVDGRFTYLAFFRVENPGCASEVSVYRQGTADAADATLTLRPVTVKTRTVTYCGSPKETVTEGPYDAQNVPWKVEVDQVGAPRLALSSNGRTEQFAALGMPQALAGQWRRGDIRPAGFYNPATGAFAPSPGAGWWLSLAADGSYRWGEFGQATDQHGCALRAWLYQEGLLSVAGSHATFSPTIGVARVENDCTPGQQRQEPWTEAPKGFTWLVHDRETSPKLVLIPDGRFEEFVFVPE